MAQIIVYVIGAWALFVSAVAVFSRLNDDMSEEKRTALMNRKVWVATAMLAIAAYCFK